MIGVASSAVTAHGLNRPFRVRIAAARTPGHTRPRPARIIGGQFRWEKRPRSSRTEAAAEGATPVIAQARYHRRRQTLWRDRSTHGLAPAPKGHEAQCIALLNSQAEGQRGARGCPDPIVIPVYAGTQRLCGHAVEALDPRVRGDDGSTIRDVH